MAQREKSQTGEATYLKGMGFSGHSVGSHISAIDVKGGKITRSDRCIMIGNINLRIQALEIRSPW